MYLDIKRGAQTAPADVGLQKKINQVGDKEQLKRMQVRFAAAAHIFGGEKSGPGEEKPEAAKNLGVKMEELAQSVGKKCRMERSDGGQFFSPQSGQNLPLPTRPQVGHFQMASSVGLV